MLFFHTKIALILIFFLTLSSTAQIPSNESPLQLAIRAQFDKTAADAKLLELPENRAFVYSKLGRLFWNFDKDRSRKLFRESLDELLKAQREAEKDRKNVRRRNDLLIWGETRRKILDNIVYVDVELALESLVASRSASVKAAFDGNLEEPLTSTFNGVSSDRMIRQQESQTEQELIGKVANMRPEKAVSILTEALKRRPAYRTVEFLTRIHGLDPSVTERLFPEILTRLIDSNIYVNSPEFQAASSLLYWYESKDVIPSLRDSNKVLFRNLAIKLCDLLLADADRNAEFTTTGLAPLISKFLPERAAELQLKTIPPRRSLWGVFPTNKTATDLLQSNATAEELLSKAENLPPEFRVQIIEKAAKMIAFSGEIEKAKNILLKRFPNNQYEQVLRNLNWQLAYNSIEKEDFVSAEKVISELPEDAQFDVMVALAQRIVTKRPIETDRSKEVLTKARKLLPDVPMQRSDLYLFGKLSDVWSRIDPEIAFDLMDRIVTKVDKVSEAEAILRGYNGDTTIHGNEFLISSGFVFSGATDLQNPLKSLTKADFARTFKMIGKLSRRDIRIALEIDALESLYSG